jgi:hypothetical protein
MASKGTDPELIRQLDSARTTGDLVRAVVRVHNPSGKAPNPEHVEEQTRRAVDRAEAASGESAADVHVMGRLAVAYVSGPERFLRELLQQPEIATAVANSPQPDR